VLGLGSGSDTGHRKTDVYGRALALVEESGVKENLTVGDGNHVGGDVSRHVTGLGLNDGKGGQGTTLVVVVELGGTLEKTRVKVEHVSGVSLTSRGTAEEEGHLTVSYGLLGEVIVENHGVHAVVTEVFSDGGTSVRSQELKRSRVGGSGRNNAGEGKGVVLFEHTSELSYGGTLLSNSYVHAVEFVLLSSARNVGTTLVNKGVQGNGSLAGLTVTNDKLTLTTADGNEGVYSLEAGVHGLVHRATGHDTRGLDFYTGAATGVEGSFAVNGFGKAVNHTSHQFASYGHVHNRSGTLDSGSLEDFTIITEDHNTDVVGIEVKGHTLNATREFNHFACFAVAKAVHTGDTVTNGKYLADLINRDTTFTAVSSNALFKDVGKVGSTGTSSEATGLGGPHGGLQGLAKKAHSY